MLCTTMWVQQGSCTAKRTAYLTLSNLACICAVPYALPSARKRNNSCYSYTCVGYFNLFPELLLLLHLSTDCRLHLVLPFGLTHSDAWL
jgi:hypothetical protein